MITLPFPLPASGYALNPEVQIDLATIVLDINNGTTAGIVNSGTAGRLALYTSTTNQVADTYIQNAKNITLAIATQASRSANLAITIPNPGNAITTANILLDSDTNSYTISGIWTFSTPIGVSSGGTGQSSYTNGQLLIGNTTGNTLDVATLTGTTNQVIVTNGAGTITLSAPQNIGTSSNVSFGSGTFSGQLKGNGTTTNDNASAGQIGEYISSTISSPTNFPTSGQFGDLTHINLTAGDWDVSAALWGAVGANWSNFAIGISSSTGNSSTGLTLGDNYIQNIFATTSSIPSQQGLSIPSYRVSLAGSTTIYLKYFANWTVTVPTAQGRISARRIR